MPGCHCSLASSAFHRVVRQALVDPGRYTQVFVVIPVERGALREAVSEFKIDQKSCHATLDFSFPGSASTIKAIQIKSEARARKPFLVGLRLGTSKKRQLVQEWRRHLGSWIVAQRGLDPGARLWIPAFT